VNNADDRPPVARNAKRTKRSIKVNRPKLTEEDIQKLVNTAAAAVDRKPIHHLEGEPHGLAP